MSRSIATKGHIPRIVMAMQDQLPQRALRVQGTYQITQRRLIFPVVRGSPESERMLGADNPFTLISRTNLAVSYRLRAGRLRRFRCWSVPLPPSASPTRSGCPHITPHSPALSLASPHDSYHSGHCYARRRRRSLDRP